MATESIPADEVLPLVIRLEPFLKLDADTFLHFSSVNRDLRLELSADGDLIVLPPTGGMTGMRNADLTYQVAHWNQQHERGTVFDSSTGFHLPNNAVRSPDVSWVSEEKLAKLTPEQMEKFPPFCPEFVLELRSPTDRLEVVKAKMQAYMENGAELGWLIDP